jgi:hypothetical protein
MPAGNWDPTQHLNAVTGQVEWPTGPYDIGQTFAPTWVDAWVVQWDIIPGVPLPFPPLPGFVFPGPSQSTHGSGPAAFAASQWTAAARGWTSGNLAAGPALGIALMAMSDGAGAYEFDWWLDVVNLQ